jgi:hypothetical protein
MLAEYFVFWVLQGFVLLLGASLGHSILILKIRREENKRHELELALLEKRAEVLKEGKQMAHELEDALFKAKVQQEIDDIIKKDKPS